MAAVDKSCLRRCQFIVIQFSHHCLSFNYCTDREFVIVDYWMVSSRYLFISSIFFKYSSLDEEEGATELASFNFFLFTSRRKFAVVRFEYVASSKLFSPNFVSRCSRSRKESLLVRNFGTISKNKQFGKPLLLSGGKYSIRYYRRRQRIQDASFFRHRTCVWLFYKLRLSRSWRMFRHCSSTACLILIQVRKRWVIKSLL